MHTKFATLILTVIPCFLCTYSQVLIAQSLENQPAEYAITHTNVIDVKSGQIITDQTIVISDGIIESVSDSDSRKMSDNMKVINAGGRFAIPGLWDMHAHLRSDGMPPWITTDWFMPLLIANGVTGVREMTSSCKELKNGPVCLDQMREWQEDINDGNILGPRLLSLSSYRVNPSWDYDLTERQARQAVQTFAKQNLDMVKIYYRLSPEAFGWMADEAMRQGLFIGGHIPVRMKVAEAASEGLRSLEHARDLLFDCYPGSKIFRREAMSQSPSIDEMHQMVDQYDSAICHETFQKMTEHETWYVPTHLTRRMEAFADDLEFRNDPRNRYVPHWMMEVWEHDADRVIAIDTTYYGRNAYLKFYQKGLEITGEAFQSGVRVLLGTDGGDSFVYPGFSVHDELKELVSAGLSPVEALRSATLHSAEFLNMEDRYGTVEPGKHADLILLNENPLLKIENTQTINAVFFRGKYLDRKSLGLLLEQAETTANRE